MTITELDSALYGLLYMLHELDVIKFYDQREDIFMAYARKYYSIMEMTWLYP